jgi:very-short-patch-repair endonuclease
MSKEIELLIASNIDKYTNNNCRIIRNETEPYALFCVSDIAKILNLTKIREHNLLYNDKVKAKTITNGGMQNVTYVTYIGLLKILTKSRKRSAYEFANAIGIDIKRISFACIEASSIDNIFKTFHGEEMIEQYKINNYIIDLYFPKYKLAIECDEKPHVTLNNKNKDEIREKKLISNLNCKFIRYKPLENDFNIFIVLNQIFTHIKTYNLQLN